MEFSSFIVLEMVKTHVDGNIICSVYTKSICHCQRFICTVFYFYESYCLDVATKTLQVPHLVMTLLTYLLVQYNGIFISPHKGQVK